MTQKAQISLFSKFLTIVIVLVAMFIFLSQVMSFNTAVQKNRGELELRTQAYMIANVLSSSGACLAYDGNLSGSSAVYENVLDARKLDNFSRYNDSQPLCAKDYYYGWRVNVSELLPRRVKTAYIGTEEPEYKGRKFVLYPEGRNMVVFGYQNGQRFNVSRKAGVGAWSVAAPNGLINRGDAKVIPTEKGYAYKLESDHPLSVLETYGSEIGLNLDYPYNIYKNYPPNGLAYLAHFDLDTSYGENITRVHDFSGNGNEGKANGTAWTRGGMMGGAYYCKPGGRNYISVPSSSSLTNFDGLTISAWVRPESLNNYMVIASKLYTEYEFRMSGGNLGFYKRSGGSYTYTDATYSFRPNEWYHVAVTWSGNKITFYVNGNMVAERVSDSYKDVIAGTNKLEIGRRSGGGYYFNGTIDEVAIYNRALYPQEIESLFRARWQYMSFLGSIYSYNAYGRHFYLTAPRNLALNGYYQGTSITVKDLTTGDDDASVHLNEDEGRMLEGFDFDVVEVTADKPVGISVIGHGGGAMKIEGRDATVDGVYAREFYFPCLGAVEITATEDGTEVTVEDMGGGRVKRKNYDIGTRHISLDRYESESVYLFAPSDQAMDYQWARVSSNKPVHVITHSGNGRIATMLESDANPMPVSAGHRATAVALEGSSLEIEDANGNVIARPALAEGQAMSFTPDRTYVFSATNPVMLYIDFFDKRLYDLRLDMRFDSQPQPPGVTIHDYSIYKNNGTNRGTPNVAAWTDKGRISGAYDFEFDNKNYISVPHNKSLTNFTGLTITAWVKPESFPTWMTVADKNLYEYEFLIYQSQMLFYKKRGTSYASCQRPQYFNADSWSHVAVTWSGNTIRFYVNGALSGECVSTDYTDKITGNHEFNISKSGSSYYFDGVIDEVRVYGRQLDQDEIQMDMFGQIASPYNGSTLAVPEQPPHALQKAYEESVWFRDNMFADFYGPADMDSLALMLDDYEMVVIGSDVQSSNFNLAPHMPAIRDWLARGGRLLVMGNDYSFMNVIDPGFLYGSYPQGGKEWDILDPDSPAFTKPHIAGKAYLESMLDDGNAYWHWFSGAGLNWTFLANGEGNPVLGLYRFGNGWAMVTASQPRYTGAFWHAENLAEYLDSMGAQAQASRWSFGDTVFSEHSAIDKSLVMEIPVGIAFSAGDSRPGKLVISIVEGDMERLSGAIELACKSDSPGSMVIKNEYPMFYDGTGGVQRLCISYGGRTACRKLACEKAVEMNRLEPGIHTIALVPVHGEEKIRVEA